MKKELQYLIGLVVVIVLILILTKKAKAEEVVVTTPPIIPEPELKPLETQIPVGYVWDYRAGVGWGYYPTK